MAKDIITVIPARLAATRLPNKPLADIDGAPMIVRVWECAMQADCGPVLVAAGDRAIVAAIEAVGGTAILTDPDLPSGSDRVFAALETYDSQGRFERVVNLQGDLPMLAPDLIKRVAVLLDTPQADMTTLVAKITDPAERDDPNVVKAVLSFTSDATARALYFTRAPAPYGDSPCYHHIGIYGYHRDALARFVALSPSPLERAERLEQLRALEAGMQIYAGLVDAVPIGVDTAEDLQTIRKLKGARNG